MRGGALCQVVGVEGMRNATTCHVVRDSRWGVGGETSAVGETSGGMRAFFDFGYILPVLVLMV